MGESKLTETLEKAIVDLIDGCLKPGKGFVLTQAPDVIKELILFEKFSNVFQIFIAGILSLALFFVVSFTVEQDGSFWMVLHTSQLVLFFWATCSIESLIKLFFAPKVFLIEYSAGLVKENK